MCEILTFVSGVEASFTSLVARQCDQPEEEVRSDEGDEAEDAHQDAAGVAHGEDGGVGGGMVGVHPGDLRGDPEEGVDDGEEDMAGADGEAGEEELDEEAAVAEGVARDAVHGAEALLLERPVENGDERLQHDRELEQEDLDGGKPAPEAGERLVLRVDTDAVEGVHGGDDVVHRDRHHAPIGEIHGWEDAVPLPVMDPGVHNAHAHEVERQHEAPHEQHLAPPGFVPGRERGLYGAELEDLQRLLCFSPEEEPEHRAPHRGIPFDVYRRRLPLGGHRTKRPPLIQLENLSPASFSAKKFTKIAQKQRTHLIAEMRNESEIAPEQGIHLLSV